MTTELRIPNVGESIQEVQIGHWLKHEGDHVDEDENVVELETDKASLELPSPVAGILKIVKQEGEAAAIGETIAYVDEAGAEPDRAEQRPPEKQPADEKQGPEQSNPKESEQKAAAVDREAVAKKETPTPQPHQPPDGQPQEDKTRSPAYPTPSARRALREYDLTAEEVEAAGKQLRREDVLRHVERQKKATGDGQKTESPAVQPAEATEPTPSKSPAKDLDIRRVGVQQVGDDQQDEVVPMTMIRRRIAERLVQAQNQAALLTTYNEIDMTAVLTLRKDWGETFRERYGIKLGLMSFFVKAVVDALQEVPELNAEIRGTDIVYRRRYDIGIAIGSEHGLVVPVLRHAERLSFAEIERAIADFAARANSRKLVPGELSGGTFTISNGGIFGSLLSTPIVNPPQSGVLGMHAIQDRPVAREGQIIIRPMMYVALTYDHRIIDGREAISWLRRVKEAIEQPARMLLEV